MKKINLTAQDYALALFVLCANIDNWKVHNMGDCLYYYFNALNSRDLSLVRYILATNGVKAKKHKTGQYTSSMYNIKRRTVLRVPVRDFNDRVSPEFKNEFVNVWKSENRPNAHSAESHHWFLLWSPTKKAEFIRKLADRAR